MVFMRLKGSMAHAGNVLLVLIEKEVSESGFYV